jgi:4-hydroxybenzoate polyprenyltransferase
MPRINVLVKLTRWKEHLPFTVPLTLLGALVALHANDTTLDFRIAPLVIANALAVAYAFMINDIEDAQDDARDPDRAQRNPISSGALSQTSSYVACVVVVLAALGLYAQGGLHVLLIGIATLVTSHLYSWRPVRLKAWPITDVTSHSLMLGGLLFLSGCFLYAAHIPATTWFIFGAVMLASISGQLHYQIRDYVLDRQAGLYNTCIAIGPSRTRILMHLINLLVAVLGLLAVVGGAVPLWVLLVGVVAVVVSAFLRTNSDMRGDSAEEISGKIQHGTLIAFNSVTSVWLVQAALMA